ncbi:MAG: nucleoside 2-deoxyribosyltransferase domain-containing protein [Clostridiaceae bacterium]|nr:nucleoside 2-deoxyribosyltransferase domain-containing protein [Clostridiaceae bacterium]
MLVYLAGTIKYFEAHDEFLKATEWRKEASNILKHTHIKTFDPCDKYEQNKEYASKGVVNQNLAYLRKSDIILVNLDGIEKSPGTMFEIFYGYMNHIPVVAFADNYLYGKQPHVTESITSYFHKFEDAVDYIQNMFSQEN